jgi:hypothetical protein
MPRRRIHVALLGVLVVPACSAPDTPEYRTTSQAEQLPTETEYVEVNGSLSVEAEDFSRSSAHSGSAWARVADETASGQEAMFVADSGVATASNEPGPRLDYRVRFTNPGAYNVWVRGHSLAGSEQSSSDSVHVGLDDDGANSGAAYLSSADIAYLRRVGVGGRSDSSHPRPPQRSTSNPRACIRSMSSSGRMGSFSTSFT